MDEILLTGVGDPHVHFRQNQRRKHDAWQTTGLLDFAVGETAQWASFALPMPNTTPSIRTGMDANMYAELIQKVSGPDLHIIKCIKAVEGFTSPEVIRDARFATVDAVKVYFEGVTTNAHEGDAVSWEGFFRMTDVWAACEEVDMVVCIHPERPKVFSLEREASAHDAIEWLASEYPRLRICVEHVTDRRTLALVESLPENVRCTITAHHLWGDLDMVIGGNLNPHAFCKPVAKLPEDRTALREAMRSGNPKFMFGSDTAPHPIEDKEHEGCAGCFTGPYCLQMLAHMLDEDGCDEIGRVLQGFAGDFARDFYRVPFLPKTIRLARRLFRIPDAAHTWTGMRIVPFLANKELAWNLM